jgi:hypothetical protein
LQSEAYDAIKEKDDKIIELEEQLKYLHEKKPVSVERKPELKSSSWRSPLTQINL